MDESEYRAKLNALEEQLADVYRARRALTQEFAGEHPPVLPPARFRTERQARVARCPRCGGSVAPEKDGAKK